MLTFVQMRTVVICFNTPFRVRSVGMEGVEMGAYGFYGAEALGGRELSVGKPHKNLKRLIPVQLPLLSLALGSSSKVDCLERRL